MKKALVTGGAGFIGSHLARALLEQGVFVRVLDNFSTGKAENLNGLNVDLINGDIRELEKAAQAMQGIDVVFHQAAFVSVPQSMQDPLTCFDINQRGTEILLEAARKAGVSRFVLASSAAVYGELDVMPIGEELPLSPLSPYAVSKRVNEIYAEMYTRSFGLDVVALRYFNVYGPRQRPDSMYAAAVPIFAHRMLNGQAVTIFGDGGQTRDLVYVGDVVRANLMAAEHPNAPGQIFNVCTGNETKVIDLVNNLMEMIPQVPAPVFEPARAGDIYKSLGDPSKAEKVLGFKAQTDLKTGLQAVVNWMKE